MGSISLPSYQNQGYVDQDADSATVRDSQDTPGSVDSLHPKTNSETSAVLKYFQNFNFPSILEELLVFITLPCVLWLVGFLLTGSECMPGGQVFTLFVLEAGGRIFGYVASWVKLPPMVGMLGVGIAIRNVPYIDFGKNFDSNLSAFLRQIALAIILTRAGLGLDLPTLWKRKGLVLRLGVCPTVLEAIVVALCSHFILDFPWAWSFMLGFVVAPVSPAVVVPRLLGLREQGYGVEKGIPTIIIASASLDNIVAISMFGVSLGFAFSKGSTVMSILQGPLEIIMGLAAGVGWGVGIGLIFHSKHQNNRNSTAIRAIMTFCGGVILILGFRYFDYSGAGALACLSSAVTASTLWRLRKVFSPDPDILCWIFYLLWYVFEPLLFGAIGCQIDLATLEARVVLLGLICIVVGAVIRFIVTFLMAGWANLNVKEKLFTGISWAPKATVQAAIGPVALDTVVKMGLGTADEKLGLQVLTIAVLTILLTAPLGELGVMCTGTRFLQRRRSSQDRS